MSPLEDLLAAARAATAGAPANCCILSAAIITRTLRSIGLTARAVPVAIYAYNRAALTCIKHDIPIHQWPNHAWSTGIQGTDRTGPDSWDGHLVTHLTLPAADGNRRTYLIDGTASQLSRPTRKLDVRNHATELPDNLLDGKHHAFTQDDGTVLVYRHLAAATAYTQSPDWKAAHPLQLPDHLARRLRAL